MGTTVRVSLRLGTLVAAGFLAACVGSNPDYAGGKPVEQYAWEVANANTAGALVMVAGKCYSPGCVLKLGAKEVRIDPDAMVSAYVRWPGYQGASLSLDAYRRGVPACARALLDRPPRMDPLSRVYGREILAACPGMKPL